MKCGVCQKKLRAGFEFQCKCQEYFCIGHLVGSTHDCKYNHHEEFKLNLSKKLPLTIGERIKRI
jgi:hypothetical protein